MSKNLPPLETKEIEPKEFGKMNRRKFLKWSLLSIAGFFGLRKLADSESELGINWPLRKAMEINDRFWQANFDSKSRAPETPSTKDAPRINGDIGMDEQVSPNWHLVVSAPALEQDLSFSLADIKKLPAVTESFEFKCIEGWSRNVTCKGVRFSDFVKSLNEDVLAEYPYASLTSVNGEYYVSMDQKSLWHSQTLLCYEMNGAELKMENGYPLRLITSVKYGVKNIKQLGSIAFVNSPPADYWAERGYGDYLGL